MDSFTANTLGRNLVNPMPDIGVALMRIYMDIPQIDPKFPSVIITTLVQGVDVLIQAETPNQITIVSLANPEFSIPILRSDGSSYKSLYITRRTPTTLGIFHISVRSVLGLDRIVSCKANTVLNVNVPLTHLYGIGIRVWPDSA